MARLAFVCLLAWLALGCGPPRGADCPDGERCDAPVKRALARPKRVAKHGGVPAGDEEVIEAPELEGGEAWLNTDRPLSLADLRGHVVVLDFWTYCCINCMHVLPELERLERRFAGRPVVVIGVHSGKFDAEKDAERIRAAMGRHGVRHPVVVDSAFEIWRSYGVTSWPTVVVVDPLGHIVGAAAGEPPEGALADLVEALLVEHSARGTLARAPLEIVPPSANDRGPLHYPGKVAVGPAGLVAIADSGHHRVVVARVAGDVASVVAVAGSGVAGSVDGPFEAAAFRRPQGLAFDASGDKLYVADTENHQLRLLDLRARAVSTIAGTGRKGEKRMQSHGGLGPALAVELRSPWALALSGQRLYVAMAGSHQIWLHDLAEGTIVPFAGTGSESIDDGVLGAASFSQPSGLALVGSTLYVADSEVSAIRAIDLDKGEVRTLVGTGLFDFGDKDGSGDDALLQHALGVTEAGGALWIADTFNNKLKRLDPQSREVRTVAGGSPEELFEPGGLARLPDGRLLVADTNNHRVRTFDTRTGALGELAVRGLEPPTARGLVSDPRRVLGGAAPVSELAASGRLGPGRGTLVVSIEPPPNAKLTEGGPLVIEGIDGPGVRFPAKLRGRLEAGKLPARLPVDIAAGSKGPLELSLHYYWCTTGDTESCIPERARLRVTVALDGPAGGEATIVHRPQAAASQEP